MINQMTSTDFDTLVLTNMCQFIVYYFLSNLEVQNSFSNTIFSVNTKHLNRMHVLFIIVGSFT